jgi:hypothetical protein
VVLLGASNVTKGISIIVETARLMLGSPLEIMCAMGHGRSYGVKSTVLGRTLPSILDSPLWSWLDQTDNTTPTYALIADIGNDVMYGIEPSQIVQWVGTCHERLSALDARIILAGLPMERIEQLRPLHFAIARRMMFPTNRISFSQVLQNARETGEALEQLAQRINAPLMPLPASWYGLDPIHIRSRHRPVAWQHLLQPWLDDHSDVPPMARGSLSRWWQIRSRSPQNWWLLGWPHGRTQPAVSLVDGTRIWLG